jgi:uncharacterized protein (DUF2062 family)
MLFRRRKSEPFGARVRVWLWPRRSFARSLQYFSKRILRLNATPHAVAAGVGAGVFASFFPLGSHFIIATVACWLIAGNLVAALLAAAVSGNPVTVPFLWGASWEAGKLILHRHLPLDGTPSNLAGLVEHASFHKLWKPILEPIAVGAVPLGLVFGLLFYGLTRWAMTTFREQRRKRIAERSARRRAVVPPPRGVGSAAR